MVGGGRSLAVINQKGGVGKTATVVNVSAGLALLGWRVLVVDIDPQGNATTGLGLDRPARERSTYGLVCGDSALEDVVVRTGVAGLDCAPSSVDLAGAEVELVEGARRERRLRGAL